MLPVFEKIEVNINHSFYVNHMKVSHFPSPLHFHPEIEILLVVQGTGTRIVGDSVERFSPGDLVIIGKNVPHVWYSDNKTYINNGEQMSEAIYIQFDQEIFGDDFWELPESRDIQKLLLQSRMGIKLIGQDKKPCILINDKSSRLPKALPELPFYLSVLELILLNEEYVFFSEPLSEI